MADLMTVITDENGEYRFDDVPYGGYNIEITDPNRDKPANLYISVTGEEPNELPPLDLLRPYQVSLQLYGGEDIVTLYTDDDVNKLCNADPYPALNVESKTFNIKDISGLSFGSLWLRDKIPDGFGMGFGYIKRFTPGNFYLGPLPSTITEIGHNFFAWGSPTFNSDILIPEGVRKIGDTFLRNASVLNNIFFPKTLREIGFQFMAYSGYILQPIVLPEGLEIIGDQFLVEGGMYGGGLYGPLTLPSTLKSVGGLFLSGMGMSTVISPEKLINNSSLPITIGGGPWSL